MKKNRLSIVIARAMALVGITAAIIVGIAIKTNVSESTSFGNKAMTNVGFVYIQTASSKTPSESDTLTTGVTVTEVFRGSPAERAGLKPGDVIISYNGTPITKDDPLFGVMRRCGGGKMVEIGILRSDASQVITISCPAQ